MSTDTQASLEHPAPERHKISLSALVFGLGAAPLVWSLQSIFGYALASYSCYPGDTPLATPVFAHVWSILIVLNVCAILISALAMAIAWRNWSATRTEHGGPPQHLLEVGEGRTRFLAMCGMLVSAGFIVAILFTAVALMLAPVCR